MKRLLLLTVLVFIGLISFGQNNKEVEVDTLWTFHPFSTDLSVGTWIPLGELDKTFKPSLQLNFAFGLRLSERVRFHLMLTPRFIFQKEPLAVASDGETVSAKVRTGASLGGWVSHGFVQNRKMKVEILAGLTYEAFLTDAERSRPNRRKDSISISGVGFSVGADTWVSTFKNLNFGLRTIYTYSTFDNSRYLEKNIGGHAFSLALVHRFPRRNSNFATLYR